MVAELREEEEWIVFLTARLEVYEKGFFFICDQDIVGAKIAVRKSEVMEVMNDIQNAKKEFFVDWLMAPQGWPIDHLHCEAIAV